MNAAYLEARVSLAAQLHGPGTVPPAPTVVKQTRCPHCHAVPGYPCVARGVGARLSRTPAHPARYEAAGVVFPVPGLVVAA